MQPRNQGTGGHLVEVRPFEIHVEADAEGPTIQLRGEIDLPALAAIEGRLAACDGVPGVLRVDLADADFLDWPVLRALLRAHERRRAAAGWLELRRGAGAVRRLLEVVAAGGLLPPGVVVDGLAGHDEVPAARAASGGRADSPG